MVIIKFSERFQELAKMVSLS